MIHTLLFRLAGGAALRRVMGQAVLSLLVAPFVAPIMALVVTVGFTSPSLAQEQVFSNDGMQWEGQAASEASGAVSKLSQDRAVLALDAARNLDEHNMLILPEPDADEVARRMAPGNSPGKDANHQPRQTGFTREVQNFEQLTPSPAGTRRGSDGQNYSVSQRLVGSTGAVSIRLHFSGVHLPAGARLYVYGSMYRGRADDGVPHSTQPRGYNSAWLGNRTSFWSHTIPGDSAVIEYHAPTERGTTGRPASYTVDQVVHNVVDIFSDDGATISAEPTDCHLDMCDNPAWQTTGNGIMRLTFVRGFRSLHCSGALLNDEAGSGTPYIYTANHCVSTQNVASTVEINYFYQRNSCSDDPNSNTVTRLGATLLATGGAGVGNADFSLLRADTAPPNGVRFLGWTTANIATNTPVTGIHHPQGSFKRISFGNKTADEPTRHRIDWSSGFTEPGSSGSPAIINGPGGTARVIGTVSTGSFPVSCSTRWNQYGKFSEAWPAFQPYLDGRARPDLIVNTVNVSTATPESGASFTINASVQNQGTSAAAATTLHYVRSSDATITATDTPLETDTVGTLAPAASSSESATVSIADAGIYWVGACVDQVADETVTGNNCSAGVRVTVRAPPGTTPAAPDLTVDSVSVSTSSVRAGTAFTINTSTRNAGTEAAAATTLFYYRSNDSTISAADTQIVADVIGALAADQVSQQSATVSIPNTGTHWVGACVNPVAGEITTSNNCSSGVQVTVTVSSGTVPSLPDLTVVVERAGVSNVTPEPGASFTIIARALNSGNSASTATTLHYVRSADSRITATDTQLATDDIGALAPGTSSPESATVSIADDGTWWVGACVDPVNGETAIDNNCSPGVEVTVTAPTPTLPDLTVDNVNVTATSVQTGVTFTINATARNSGNGASPATTLRYYRSADDTITTDDSQLATDRVSALAAGATSVESAAVSIANTGTWWIGACVATVADESDTANNCSTGVSVSVTAPPVVVPTSPDLIVDTVSVSATSVQTGVSFTINATARNSGDGASAATTLRYYRSANNTITTTDTPIGTDAVGGLSAGGSSRESTTVSIAIARTWWVGACVEAVNGEVARTNNCSTAVQVTVTAPPVVVPTLPDLTVDNVSVSESTVETDVSFTINATVRNSGNGAASAATLSYYRSADSTITTADTEVATDPVDGLAPSRSSQQSATVSITNTGTWWVGACVGTVNGETAINNNCSNGVEVTVTAPALPDLTVDSVSVSASTVETDVSFTINATARNPGTGTSAATTLRYFRSDDATITTADTEVATDPVGPLAPGGSAQQNAVVAITETGTWWVGACIGTVSDETETGNNCSDSVQVTVTASDLIVDSISVAESSVEADAAFTINATVQNQGTAASVATTLHYYGSDDSTITASDTQLATRSVEALAADTSSQQSAEVVIADAGSYWVGACVAEVNNESATDNNCSSGVPVTVTARPDNNGGILPAIIQLLLLP